MEYVKEHKNRERNRILFQKWRTVWGQLEKEHQNKAVFTYIQIDGLFQSKLRILETGDTLRDDQISIFLELFQISAVQNNLKKAFFDKVSI